MKPKFNVSVTIDQDLADDISVLEKAFPGLTRSQLLRKAFEIAAKKIFDDALVDSAEDTSGLGCITIWSHLVFNGWTQTGTTNNNIGLFENPRYPGRQLQVPMSCEIDDYTEMMVRAVQKLKDIESNL